MTPTALKVLEIMSYPPLNLLFFFASSELPSAQIFRNNTNTLSTVRSFYTYRCKQVDPEMLYGSKSPVTVSYRS